MNSFSSYLHSSTRPTFFYLLMIMMGSMISCLGSSFTMSSSNLLTSTYRSMALMNFSFS